ncbi:MAG: DUF4175 family protein [Planctomycetales bacterium]
MATLPFPENNSQFAVPEIVSEKITSVVKQTRGRRLLSGAILGLGAGLVVMLLAIVADWMLVLFDPALRGQLTFIACIGMGILGLASVIFAALRSVTPLDVARQIDRQHPELQERWTSVTEFSTTTAALEVQGSEALRKKVAQEAAALGVKINPTQVRMGREMSIAWVGLGAALALWLIAVLIDPGHMTVLVRRFLSPTSEISMTRIHSLTGNVVHPRGTNLKLEASLEGRAQTAASLIILPAGGTEQTYPLEVLPGEKPRFEYPLKNLQTAFTYRFRSGDGQSSWHEVQIADRPTFKKIAFKIIPPAYSKLPEIQRGSLPKSIQALQGSKLVLQFEVSQPPKSLLLQGDNKVLHSLTPAEGNVYRWETLLEESLAFRAVMESNEGLTNERPPRCEIAVYQDQAPVVDLVTPTEDVAVRPDDTLTIAFDAKDDLGITRAELVVTEDSPGNPEKELKTIPIPLGGQQGKKSVHCQTALELKDFHLKHGEKVTYAIRVYDTKDKVTTHRPSGSPPESSPVAQASKPQNSSSQESPSSSEPKQGDSKVGETKPTDGKAAESKPGESKDGAAKDGEPKVGEQKAEEQQQTPSDVKKPEEAQLAKNQAEGGTPGRPKSANEHAAKPSEGERCPASLVRNFTWRRMNSTLRQVNAAVAAVARSPLMNGPAPMPPKCSTSCRFRSTRC